MEITYLSGASFQIKADRIVALNPPQGIAADVVLHSARQNSSKHIVNGPGEYEISGVLIFTVEAGPKDSATLVHAIETGGVSIVHLGTPLHQLDKRALEALGRVDILLLNAEDLATAQEAVRDLEPRIVIPFGSRAPELCVALGVREPRAESRFSWNGLTTPPKAVLLKAPGARKRAA